MRLVYLGSPEAAVPPLQALVAAGHEVVLVVSMPQKAAQSFTTMPPPSTSLPRFTVPATSGTCSRLESSSWSSIEVRGCTMPPAFEKTQ